MTEEREVDSKSVSLDDAFDSAYEELVGEEEEKEAKEVEVEEGEEQGVAEPEQSEDVEDTASKDDTEEEEPVDKLAPKEHWPAEDKALYDKIEDEAAKELVQQIDKRLSAAHQRRTQEHAESMRTHEAMQSVLSPYKERIAQYGMSEAQAVAQLFQQRAYYDDQLANNPKEFLTGLAKQYGVDLAGDEDGGDDWVDPQVAALQQKLQAVEGQFQQFTGNLQSQQNQRVQSIISEFSTATNEDGTPKHPHYERLRGTMSVLLENGQAQDLEGAYDMALRADPELFQQLLDKQLQDRIKAEEERRKVDIEKAKKAKRRLSGHGVSRKAPTKVSSIDDALDAAYSQLSQG